MSWSLKMIFAFVSILVGCCSDYASDESLKLRLKGQYDSCLISIRKAALESCKMRYMLFDSVAVKEQEFVASTFVLQSTSDSTYLVFVLRYGRNQQSAHVITFNKVTIRHGFVAVGRTGIVYAIPVAMAREDGVQSASDMERYLEPALIHDGYYDGKTGSVNSIAIEHLPQYSYSR